LLTTAHSTFVSHAQLYDRAAKAGLGWSLEARLAILEIAVPPAIDGQDLVLIGRSSGARVVTLFAAKRPVAAVVCVAYPFKNPKHVLEVERFAHLATLATPTLIIQGSEDVYGGVELTENYALSPSIRLEFIDAGHEFVLASPPCADVPRLIANFALGDWRVPATQAARFDERFYTTLYPEVAKAIDEGSVLSGEAHFRLYGQRERRRFRLLRERG
jgi:predicted alpha/beta-hydrolase family hydrolase